MRYIGNRLQQKDNPRQVAREQHIHTSRQFMCTQGKQSNVWEEPAADGGKMCKHLNPGPGTIKIIQSWHQTCPSFNKRCNYLEH